MRGMWAWGIALVVSLGAVGAASAQNLACATVKVEPDVAFDGRKLREIADIADPTLRRINTLLTQRCFDEAQADIEAFVAAHPGDHRVTYAQARGAWMTGSPAEAETLLSETISKYPDFASAYILLAGLKLDHEQYAEVGPLLDKAERLSPSDLWLFVDRLRLAALTSPDRALVETMARVMRDKRFRRDVRVDMFALILDNLQSLADAATIDAAHQTHIAIGYNSPEDSITSYAFWLIEDQQRTADAREWLEPLLKTRLRHPEVVHKLLAESYLFDAARIDPVQTERNFALIEKARNEMGGSIDSLARDAALNPRFKPLQGFFAVVEDIDKPNELGETGLCTGLQALALDVPMIKSMLANLADPNQHCSGPNTTPVGVILMFGRSQTAERRELLKELLARGADPDPTVFNMDAITFCKQDGRCDALLDILQPAWDAAGKH